MTTEMKVSTFDRLNEVIADAIGYSGYNADIEDSRDDFMISVNTEDNGSGVRCIITRSDGFEFLNKVLHE